MQILGMVEIPFPFSGRAPNVFPALLALLVSDLTSLAPTVTYGIPVGYVLFFAPTGQGMPGRWSPVDIVNCTHPNTERPIRPA